MNFFDASLSADGDNIIVDVGAFTLRLPPSKTATYSDHIGADVIVGIRPEDIHDSNYLPQGIIPANLASNVEVVEQMGNEVIIYLESGGKNFIARTDPRTGATVGEEMGVTLNLDNIHIFDSTNELSLAYDEKRKAAMEA